MGVIQRGKPKEIKQLVCLGPLLESFPANASEAWPDEHDVIVAFAEAFSLEIFAIKSYLAAKLVDDMGRMHVLHAVQVMPFKSICFFAKPELPAKGGKSAEKTLMPLRPGWESSFKTPTPHQKQMSETTQVLFSLLKGIQNGPQTIAIHDLVIEPKSFFCEALMNRFKRYF
jgi:hypothetical protein